MVRTRLLFGLTTRNRIGTEAVANLLVPVFPYVPPGPEKVHEGVLRRKTPVSANGSGHMRGGVDPEPDLEWAVVNCWN